MMTTPIATNYMPQAPATLMSPNGVALSYGYGAATDVARAAAVVSAVADAISGDLIRLGPGVFDFGVSTRIDLPNGVSLVGAGQMTTKLLSNLDKATGVFLSPGDNSYIAEIEIDSLGQVLTIPIGAINRASWTDDKDFSGVIVSNVTFTNEIDALQIFIDTGGLSNQVYDITFKNCKFVGAWDAISVNVTTLTPTITIDLFNCEIYSDASSQAIVAAMGLLCNSGNALVRVYGGSVTIFGASVVNHGVKSNGPSCALEIHDVSIFTSGTSAFDVVQQNSGSLLVAGGHGSGTNGAYTTSGTITRRNAGVKTLTFQVVDYTTDVSTGDGQFYWHCPAALAGGNITAIHGFHVTAGTVLTCNVSLTRIRGGTPANVLSTKLTIDAGEIGSDTAAIPAVIDADNADLLENDQLRVDVDTTGSTKPKGLIITIEVTL